MDTLNNLIPCTCICNCTCTCTCKCNNYTDNTYGELILDHQGAFLARFYISWEETTNGNSTRKEWSGNGQIFTAPYRTTITIPMSATNLSIKAEGNTGLVWQLWTTIIDRVGLAMVPTRTVKLWGTTLDQHGSVTPDGGYNAEFGELILDHQGAYLARFFISWEETSSVNGNSYATRKEWSGNGQIFTAPYRTTISIPMTAKNLSIKAEGNTGLVWQLWTTILDAVGLSMVPSRTVKLWGTTLDQHGSITPDAGNNGGNTEYGNLILDHKGGYIARFYIYWDEPTYVGNSVVPSQKSWSYNGDNFTAPYYTTIPIPMNATNIRIKAEGNTGLVWQLWTTILDKIGLAMVATRTVTLWGTSLDQHGSVEPS